MDDPKDTGRLTTYVPKEEKRAFKSKLALEGKSMSEFFREAIQQYLNRTTNQAS